MTPYFPHSLTTRELLSAQTGQLSALDEVLSRRRLYGGERADYQVRAMSDLLNLAYEDFPFYREKYNRAGFHPRQFCDLNDLTKIPVLTKSELRGLRSDHFGLPNAGSYRLLQTSGSSGSPVTLPRDAASLYQFSAYNLLLYYLWCGGNPLRNVLYFLDPTPNTIDFALAEMLRLTVSDERILSAFLPANEQTDILLEIRPEFVSSYPTTMRLVAAELRSRRIVVPSLKILHLTSEATDELTRRNLQRVFPNARIWDSYTCTEAGLVAYPCLSGNGYHVPETQTLAEIVDEENHSTGEYGRIIVTDLVNRAFPLIRYSGLEDYCRAGGAGCSCGDSNMCIAQIEGRMVDSICLRGGKRLSPYVATTAVSHVEHVVAYQIVQEDYSAFTVRIVPQAAEWGEVESLRGQIIAALRGALGEPVEITVQFETALMPPSGRRKLPLVVSKVERVK